MMRYSSTVTIMMTAFQRVALSVVTPVRNRLYLRVKVRSIAIPCKRIHENFVASTSCPEAATKPSDAADRQTCRTFLSRSQRPTRRLAPHAIVCSMMVDPASVPTPMATCASVYEMV